MKACSLDTLARDPEQPVAAECFLTFEAKALRECREALSGPGGVGDAYSYAEANPHPRLWRLVGEAALEKLELTVAEKALVQVTGCHCHPVSYTHLTLPTICSV